MLIWQHAVCKGCWECLLWPALHLSRFILLRGLFPPSPQGPRKTLPAICPSESPGHFLKGKTWRKNAGKWRHDPGRNKKNSGLSQAQLPRPTATNGVFSPQPGTKQQKKWPNQFLPLSSCWWVPISQRYEWHPHDNPQETMAAFNQWMRQPSRWHHCSSRCRKHAQCLLKKSVRPVIDPTI